jgi:hypothetical protein
MCWRCNCCSRSRADPADARGAAVRNPGRPGQRRPGDRGCSACRATAPGCVAAGSDDRLLDSAKDAGTTAAAWAQYRAQENLVRICRASGRTAAVPRPWRHRGRGGGPAHAAILSQPPGSVAGRFRTTEQGEMIRFKFGLPGSPSRTSTCTWPRCWKRRCCHRRHPAGLARVMDQLAADGVKAYRSVVRENRLCRVLPPVDAGAGWGCRWAAARPSAVPVASKACGRSVDLRLDPDPPDAAGLAGLKRR